MQRRERVRRHDWGRDEERDQSFLTLPAVCLKPSGKKERTGMYEEETEEKEVGETYDKKGEGERVSHWKERWGGERRTE